MLFLDFNSVDPDMSLFIYSFVYSIQDEDIDPLEEEIRPPSRPRSSSGCLTRFAPSSSTSRPLTPGVMGETSGTLDGTVNDESKDTRYFLPPRSQSLPPNARSRPYTPSTDFGQRASSDRKNRPPAGSGNKVVDGQFQFSPSVERRGSESTGVVEV